MEWKTTAISSTIAAVLAVLLRLLPAEKILSWITPWAKGLGIAFSKILLSWMPRALAEKVEDGIICTVVDVIVGGFLSFRDGLVGDNIRRLNTKAGGGK